MIFQFIVDQWLQYVFLLIFISLIGLLLWNANNIRIIENYPKVQHFSYIPFVGHPGLLKYLNASTKDTHDLINIMSPESGRLLTFLGYKMIVVSKVEQIELILTHPNTQDKHYIYDFLAGPLFGKSMFCLNGESWRQTRKKIAPIMHTENIKEYGNDISTFADMLANRFREKTGPVFDAKRTITKGIIHLFINIFMAVDPKVETVWDELISGSEIVSGLFVRRVVSVLKHPQVIYNFLNDGRQFKEVVPLANKIAQAYLSERKSIYKKFQNGAEEEEAKATSKKPRREFIDYLLDLKFNDNEILDEIKFFIFAGVDTNSSTISFTLIALAIHQDVQEKAYEEVTRILNVDRPATYEDFKKMTYLNQVLNESMRLFPPAPIVNRVAGDDFCMDGKHVPKGTQLMCNIIAMQRSPLYWEDAMKFDPDRFSPEELAKQKQSSFMPFLIGSRTCFGMRLAWLTSISSIAALIKNYKWFTPYKSLADIELEYTIVLNAVGGVLLQCKKRN